MDAETADFGQVGGAETAVLVNLGATRRPILDNLGAPRQPILVKLGVPRSASLVNFGVLRRPILGNLGGPESFGHWHTVPFVPETWGGLCGKRGKGATTSTPNPLVSKTLGQNWMR